MKRRQPVPAATQPASLPPLTPAARAATAALADALSTVIREAVFDAFVELVDVRDTARPTPELLTVEQICEGLQVSRATLHRLRLDGLPTIMLLDSPRFKLADCVAWLEARTAERQSKP